MRGVTHRKCGGHGKRVHLRRHALYGFVQGVQIQGSGLVAVVVMAAANALYSHTGKSFGNAGALGHAGIKTYQQHAHRAAMAFHHGIGGQGGGHRDQCNILRPQALGQGGNGLGNGISHA